jgi:hypothetical protein
MLPNPKKVEPAQPVDATPSELNPTEPYYKTIAPQE